LEVESTSWDRWGKKLHMVDYGLAIISVKLVWMRFSLRRDNIDMCHFLHSSFPHDGRLTKMLLCLEIYLQKR
jgi:hypothetical protein